MHLCSFWLNSLDRDAWQRDRLQEVQVRSRSREGLLVFALLVRFSAERGGKTPVFLSGPPVFG